MIGYLIRRVRNHGGPDGGAVLVLAVLFVLIVGVTGGAIASLATTNLAVTSVLGGDRTQSYAAQSAVQVAIDSLRQEDALITSTPGYSNGHGGVVPCPSAPMAAGGLGAGSPALTVMCGVGVAPLSGERTVIFVACLSTSNCLDTSTSYAPKPQAGAIVVATTVFNDISAAPQCQNQLPIPAACFAPGTSVDVTGWDVSKSNS